MEGMDDGGGLTHNERRKACREITERSLIASHFPSPLRLFGVDVDGVRDERGSPSDERGSRGVQDELGYLGVGFGFGKGKGKGYTAISASEGS